jgi:hypothetical protein
LASNVDEYNNHFSHRYKYNNCHRDQYLYPHSHEHEHNHEESIIYGNPRS